MISSKTALTRLADFEKSEKECLDQWLWNLRKARSWSVRICGFQNDYLHNADVYLKLADEYALMIRKERQRAGL